MINIITMTLLTPSDSDYLFIPNEILQYGEVQNVGHSVETTIATYTNTDTFDKRITRIMISGNHYAQYKVYLDTNVIANLRTGPDRNGYFHLNMRLTPGQILDVKASHNYDGINANFESTIFGY